MTTFIIPDCGTELRVTKAGDTIYLWHNGGIKSFDQAGAEALIQALRAVASGEHLEAITASALAARAKPAPGGDAPKLLTLDLKDLDL